MERQGATTRSDKGGPGAPHDDEEDQLDDDAAMGVEGIAEGRPHVKDMDDKDQQAEPPGVANPSSTSNGPDRDQGRALLPRRRGLFHGGWSTIRGWFGGGSSNATARDDGGEDGGSGRRRREE